MPGTNRKGGGGGWRTVRVLVELPIKGRVTDEQFVWAIKQALVEGDIRQQVVRRNPTLHQQTEFGNLRVKEYARVKRADTQRQADVDVVGER